MTAFEQLQDFCQETSSQRGLHMSYAIGHLGDSNVHLEGAWALGKPIEPTCIFDLASLTKVIAAPLIVSDLFAHTQHADTQSVQEIDAKEIYAIARHQAGFPAWLPFYLTTENKSERKNRIHNILSAILSISPHPNHTQRCYSDIGFMRLYALLEWVMGRGVQETFQRYQNKWVPQSACRYLPLDYGIPNHACIAPTEICPWRKRHVIGQVHDANCYALGGVGLHAGLFGSAQDVAEYALWWLHLMSQAQPFDDSEVTLVQTALTDAQPLFFDIASPHGTTGGVLSKYARGHLGYTGTSVWIDPDFPSGPAYFVLLSNWSFPNDNRDGLLEFRRSFHRYAADILSDN